MLRPICKSCGKNHCAVNYIREGITHYRSGCDECGRKKKKLKPRKANWTKSGYKKKATCDRCGFKSKYSAQTSVYHVDGNLHNTGVNNLKTVCLNCTVEIKKSDLSWQPGDLVPDL